MQYFIYLFIYSGEIDGILLGFHHFPIFFTWSAKQSCYDKFTFADFFLIWFKLESNYEDLKIQSIHLL